MCSIVLSNTIRTFERRFILIDIRTRERVSTCQKDFENSVKKMENFSTNWENSGNLIFVPNFLFCFYTLNLFMLWESYISVLSSPSTEIWTKVLILRHKDCFHVFRIKQDKSAILFTIERNICRLSKNFFCSTWSGTVLGR